MEAITEAQALGMSTTQEAQAIGDKHGKMLVLIMTAAGLTTKATWAKSVWNKHQAWYAHTNPKASQGKCHPRFSFCGMLTTSQRSRKTTTAVR